MCTNIKILLTVFWVAGINAATILGTDGGVDAVHRAVDGTTNEACRLSIRNWRIDNWTEWARSGHAPRRKLDLGIGEEYCIKCIGCDRYLPQNMMTGDHIIPQSDDATLLAELRRLDNISDIDWSLLESINAVKIRNHPVDGAAVDVSSRNAYKDPAKMIFDCRNLQAMCGTCNTNRGPGRAKPATPGGYTAAVLD